MTEAAAPTPSKAYAATIHTKLWAVLAITKASAHSAAPIVTTHLESTRSSSHPVPGPMNAAARLMAEVSIDNCVRLQSKCFNSGVKNTPAVS